MEILENHGRDREENEGIWQRLGLEIFYFRDWNVDKYGVNKSQALKNM